MAAGTEITIYLIKSIGSLVLFFIILRGVLHASRANFYNPITQTVLKCTNPLLSPLRGLVPTIGRIDWAVISSAVLLQSTILASISFISGENWAVPGLVTLALWGIIGVLGLLTQLYFFILLAMIIISWVAPASSNPLIELIWQISEPVMKPFRALVPSMGGVDFSPILLFITIKVLQIALHHSAVATGLPVRLLIAGL